MQPGGVLARPSPHRPPPAAPPAFAAQHPAFQGDNGGAPQRHPGKGRGSATWRGCGVGVCSSPYGPSFAPIFIRGPPKHPGLSPVSAGGGAGFAPGPRLRANSRLLPQQSLYSCEEGTFSSPAGLGSSASPAAFGPGRPEDTSCFRSTASWVGSETPYKKLVTATAEGASWPAGLAMGPLAPESRPPLEAREVQVNSTLGFGSRLGSSAGLRGREGEEEEKKTRFLQVCGTAKAGQARMRREKESCAREGGTGCTTAAGLFVSEITAITQPPPASSGTCTVFVLFRWSRLVLWQFKAFILARAKPPISTAQHV